MEDSAMIEFKIYRFYRHRAFTDVCFRVNEVQGNRTFGVSWYLYRPGGEPIPMGFADELTIKVSEVHNYKELPL